VASSINGPHEGLGMAAMVDSQARQELERAVSQLRCHLLVNGDHARIRAALSGADKGAVNHLVSGLLEMRVVEHRGDRRRGDQRAQRTGELLFVQC
jgi:hypothetical protein